MDEAAFTKLKEAIKKEPWRDPSINRDACDGEAWEINSYKEDGSIDKTSGKLGYIYGQRILEAITELLPLSTEHYEKECFQAQK